MPPCLCDGGANWIGDLLLHNPPLQGKARAKLIIRMAACKAFSIKYLGASLFIGIWVYNANSTGITSRLPVWQRWKHWPITLFLVIQRGSPYWNYWRNIWKALLETESRHLSKWTRVAVAQTVNIMQGAQKTTCIISRVISGFPTLKAGRCWFLPNLLNNPLFCTFFCWRIAMI